ncbi:MAG: ABC transporter permease [Meiothermus sp.]|nr:ABC transporter permease [Meiothermus sp.]
MSYLARRFALFLLVLWGVSVTVFAALQLAPGNPAQLLLGPQATPETLERVTRELGLDRPVLVQYWRWLSSALQGDLGTSITLREPVNKLVFERLANSMILAIPAFFLATFLGLSLGILSVIFRRGWLDHTANTLMFVGLAIPVFWLGLVLIIVFGLRLGWLPVSGMYPPGGERSFEEIARHLVLPAVTLAVAPAAVIAQIARSALLDEVTRDYVRTAVSKGLSQRSATVHHALRNTWIPVVTALGLEINYVIGGAVLVENVFNWPGIGQLLVQAALNRDYPVVLGASLVLAAIFVAVNFLVEAVYVLIDPRVKGQA